MKLMTAALTCICFMPLRWALADIVAPEEFDSISSPAEPGVVAGGASSCSVDSSVSVQISAGDMTFPYGPPGFKEYKGTSRASGIGFGLHKPICFKSFLRSVEGRFSFSNSFPSSGRTYDVQAVSWNEMSILGAANSTLFNNESMDTVFRIGLGANYERFQYGRGTFSFQMIPANLGLETFWHLDWRERPISVGVGFAASKISLSRTLIKYDPAPTSSKANASIVEINPDQKIVGQDFEMAAHFGFSSSVAVYDPTGDSQHQHQLSLIWNTKNRAARDFLIERIPSSGDSKRFDLDMKSTALTLRWSERI
jgi:hypothetical protein